MCGRYKPPQTWEEYVQVMTGIVAPPDQNDLPMEYRPTNKVPIILPGVSGYEVTRARWGLVPSFFKGDPKDWKAATFNARLEDIADKPTFRNAWKRKQFCLMPAAYFWEWSGPHPKDPKKKQRWRIERADNHSLAFAGLYDIAGDVTSCTILMHAEGDDMRPLHDREPAILHPDEWQSFLAGRLDRDLQEPVKPGTLRIEKEFGFDAGAGQLL